MHVRVHVRFWGLEPGGCSLLSVSAECAYECVSLSLFLVLVDPASRALCGNKPSMNYILFFIVRAHPPPPY